MSMFSLGKYSMTQVHFAFYDTHHVSPIKLVSVSFRGSVDNICRSPYPLQNQLVPILLRCSGHAPEIIRQLFSLGKYSMTQVHFAFYDTHHVSPIKLVSMPLSNLSNYGIVMNIKVLVVVLSKRDKIIWISFSKILSTWSNTSPEICTLLLYTFI
jgi:hypothetical protein